MKDAHGHGSNGRGEANVGGQRTPFDKFKAERGASYASAATNWKFVSHMNEPNTELGSLHESNKSAARELAMGNPKARPVPIHSGAFGRLTGSGA